MPKRAAISLIGSIFSAMINPSLFHIPGHRRFGRSPGHQAGSSMVKRAPCGGLSLIEIMPLCSSMML